MIEAFAEAFMELVFVAGWDTIRGGKYLIPDNVTVMNRTELDAKAAAWYPPALRAKRVAGCVLVYVNVQYGRVTQIQPRIRLWSTKGLPSAELALLSQHGWTRNGNLRELAYKIALEAQFWPAQTDGFFTYPLIIAFDPDR
jgi:hypothetical protein